MPNPLKQRPEEVHRIVSLGRQRLQQVNAKIRILAGMRKQLEHLIDHLEGTALPLSCPVAHGVPKKTPRQR
jgi:hypothetical protein